MKNYLYLFCSSFEYVREGSSTYTEVPTLAVKPHIPLGTEAKNGIGGRGIASRGLWWGIDGGRVMRWRLRSSGPTRRGTRRRSRKIKGEVSGIERPRPIRGLGRGLGHVRVHAHVVPCARRRARTTRTRCTCARMSRGASTD